MRSLAITVLAVLGLSLLTAIGAQAHPSWGIVVDRQGQVYFSDLKTIWKIDAQGRAVALRTSDNHVHDLNIDETGNLYGAENSYEPSTKRFFSAIWKMTPAGDFSYLLAPTDDPPEGTSIWKDRDGNMYHVGYYPERELLILRRTPGGEVTVLAGSSNAAREYRQGVPYSVGGIAFGTDGALYFTHGASASKLAMTGALTQLARNLVIEKDSGNKSGAGSQTQLFGIAVDAQGNAFIADYGNRRVLKVTPEGQTTTLLRAEENWFPTGVAMKGSELYILEIGQRSPYEPIGTRVRKLSPDGKVTVLATVGANGKAASAPSSSDEDSSGQGSERKAESRRLLYLVLGAVTAVFALTIIVWRVRRPSA
ncbi:MAG: hypothetical protein ICV60_08885 [Pyrinomonadaceae bacterium]|nr:hypothetical protein [Pyrinomonadaceae bacterium]